MHLASSQKGRESVRRAGARLREVLALYTPLADHRATLTFIETEVFTGQITQLITDEVYLRLQERLIRNPEAGELIRQGGGIRKVRVERSGVGRSRGARVIYYWQQRKSTIYMLAAYAKSVRTDLSPREIEVLHRLVKAL